MSKKKWNIIGLMSGTSVDGIDAAWVEITPRKHYPDIELKAFKTFPYAKTLRKEILLACSHRPQPIEQLCELNFKLGNVFADAVLKLAKSARISLKKIDLIASHGQTVRHLPAKKATLQIGEPSLISEKTGVTTIADFRPSDMAAGGQGAPLAPYLHYCLFRSIGHGVGIQNIGGIGNLTFIPKRGHLKDVIAFDTGPGNVLMDSVMFMSTRGRQSFDMNGQCAARGKINDKMLKSLLSHSYFKQPLPKTTGRELFGCSMAERFLRKHKRKKRDDLMATLTAFTAHSIAKACTHPKLKGKMRELVIGGGGAKNKTLCYMIQKLLPTIQVKRFEDYMLNSDAIEAMAFALLAYETVQGNPGNIPKATGAAHPKILGKVIPGYNFKRVFLN